VDEPIRRPVRPAADAGATPLCYPQAAEGNPRDHPERAGAGARLRRIGIFGGSFDPVHVGHLHVARRAQAARDLERVVFVPAAVVFATIVLVEVLAVTELLGPAYDRIDVTSVERAE
jgi:cytidyltransferase-like protein